MVTKSAIEIWGSILNLFSVSYTKGKITRRGTEVLILSNYGE